MFDALDYSEFAKHVSEHNAARLIVISASNGGSSLRWNEAFPNLADPGRLNDGPLILSIEDDSAARSVFDQIRRDLTGGNHSLINATAELFADGSRLGGFEYINGRYEPLNLED